MIPQDLVERLLELPDLDAQKRFLKERVSLLNEEVADTLKEHANRFLRTAVQRSLGIAELFSYIAKLTKNPLHRALGLLVDANAHSIGGLGEHQRAVELYDKAANIYQNQGLIVEQAKTQVGKVFSLAMLGRYDQALEIGHWAGPILEEHRQWRPLVNLTMNLAIVHGRQREDTKALAQFDRARVLCHKLGSDGAPLLQLVEHNRAVVLRNLGQFQSSIQAGHAAWELAKELGRKAEIGRVQQAIAFTYLLQGRYNEALELLDQARDIFLSDGRQSDAVLVELFISDCLLQLRRFHDVLDKCRQLRDLFTERSMRREEADATLNEALACAGLQRYTEAQALLTKARHLFEQEGNWVQVACTDLEMAAVLYHQNQLKESLTTALACARAFQAHDLPVQEAQAFLIAARTAASLERYGQAYRLVTRALAVGKGKDIPSLVFQCYHLLGVLAYVQGDQQDALAEYDRAIRELERLRGRLMVEFRADFLEDKQVIYEDVVALCLDLEQPIRGLEYAERAKSRALLDLLAYRLDVSIQAREPRDGPLVEELLHLRAKRDRLYRRWEVNQGFTVRGRMPAKETRQQMRQDVLALERRIEKLWHTLLVRNADYARDAVLCQVRAEPIQPYLSPETMLLEYFIVHGQLVAFLVTAEQVRARRLPVDLARVRQLIQLLWLNLRAVPRSTSSRVSGLTSNACGLLRQLYELLLAPLHDALSLYPQLIIVPHGPLHYVPLHALHDGCEFLLERHLISYLPGASLLRYCRELRPVTADCVAIGHSYGGALPYTLQEARTVALILEGEAILEDNATPATLREMAPGCRVLHLAAHGDFRPDNPLFSGLALSGGWLTTLDIFGLSLKTSLVTLSACQTGRSVIGGGDELLGLMRAFLYAGVASLVLSLWAVEDRCTSELMEVFYNGLAEGRTKGEALRFAQLQLLKRQSGPKDAKAQTFCHPYFWAPFFLVGDTGSL